MESGNDQTFCLFLHVFRTLEISNKFSIFHFISFPFLCKDLNLSLTFSFP